MSEMESLPAHEYKAPFRVDPIGLARRDEQEAQGPSGEQLDAVIAAAETAGSLIIESEAELVA